MVAKYAGPMDCVLISTPSLGRAVRSGNADRGAGVTALVRTWEPITDRGDAGHLSQAGQQHVAVLFLIRILPCARIVERECDHVLRDESRIDGAQARQAVREQSRRHHQHHGKRHLHHHQNFAKAGARAAAGLLRPAILQGGGGIERRGAQSRRQPEQDGRKNRDAQREPQHGRIRRDVESFIGAGRQKQEHVALAPNGECQAQNAAQQGQQQAFDQPLPHQPPARGAQREAHGNFAAARGSARNQQVGHVRAGDQQHQAHGRHQDRQGLPNASRSMEMPTPASRTSIFCSNANLPNALARWPP
jgi:hypothetical protein